jgi:integrase/recombinase XerD
MMKRFVIYHAHVKLLAMTVNGQSIRSSHSCFATSFSIKAPLKVHVRCGKGGKGGKDRFVILPDRTLLLLRKYWVSHRNRVFLFPRGKTNELRGSADAPMDRGGLQKSIKIIVKSCGIHKRVTIHTFCHCYGAHLVEAGVNLRAIQHQMGHECPKTTALYTQLTETTQNNTGVRINGLIDGLDFEVIR